MVVIYSATTAVAQHLIELFINKLVPNIAQRFCLMHQSFCNMLTMLQQIDPNLLKEFKSKTDDLSLSVIKSIPELLEQEKYDMMSDVLRCIVSLMAKGDDQHHMKFSFVVKRNIICLLECIVGVIKNNLMPILDTEQLGIDAKWGLQKSMVDQGIDLQFLLNTESDQDLKELAAELLPGHKIQQGKLFRAIKKQRARIQEITQSHVIQEIWNLIGYILCHGLYIKEAFYGTSKFILAQVLMLEVMQASILLYRQSGIYSRLSSSILYFWYLINLCPQKLFSFIKAMRNNYPLLLQDIINLLQQPTCPDYSKIIIQLIQQIILTDAADNVEYMVNYCGLLDTLTKAVSETNEKYVERKSMLLGVISHIILKNPQCQQMIDNYVIFPVIFASLATSLFNQRNRNLVISAISCINTLLYCGNQAIIAKLFLPSHGFIRGFIKFSNYYKKGCELMTLQQNNEVNILLSNMLIIITKYSLKEQVVAELKRYKFNDIVDELIPVLSKRKHVFFRQILIGFQLLNK